MGYGTQVGHLRQIFALLNGIISSSTKRKKLLYMLYGNQLQSHPNSGLSCPHLKIKYHSSYMN